MKTRILNIILLLGIAIGGASCVFDDYSNCPEPIPEAPVIPDSPEMLTLSLNISFDGQDSGTRADNDPNGTPPYEGPSCSRENISTLRVIIIRDSVAEDADGKPTTTVVKREIEGNRLVATSPLGYPLYDNLEFKVIANENKRIYLIANESTLTPPAGVTGTVSKYLDGYKVGNSFPLDDSTSELTKWTVSISDTDIKEVEIDGKKIDVTNNGIFPPFAITEEGKDPTISYPEIPLTEYFDIYVTSEKAVDDIFTKNLFITRIAAKATFYLDPSGLDPVYKDLKISSLSLSGIGAEEYVFPNDAVYSKGKYQQTSKPDVEMYISSFKTPPSSRTLTYLMEGLDIDMVPKDTEVGTEPREIYGPIYFPESILANEQYYEVAVTLSNGVELKAPLKTEGENTANILNINGREAIARNTHLKITLKIEAQELFAEVTIVPYIGIDLKPSFGFEQLLPGDHHQPTDW